MTESRKPIACSLTAAEMSRRVAEMRAAGRDWLLSAETAGSEARLRFRATAGAPERLAAIVAAEARCCPFLELDLTREPRGLALTIRAPEGGEPVLRELVRAFRGEPPA